MASKAAMDARSIRESLVGLILEKHEGDGFINLEALQRWFAIHSAHRFIPAMKKAARDDETFASAAYGSLTSVMVLLDTSIRKGHSVEEFIGVLKATIPIMSES